MKTEQYQVTNKESKDVYIFNRVELDSFFKINKLKKYEVISMSTLRQITTDNILLFINCSAIIGTSLYLLSQWI
jgi:hypothetical protein